MTYQATHLTKEREIWGMKKTVTWCGLATATRAFMILTSHEDETTCQNCIKALKRSRGIKVPGGFPDLPPLSLPSEGRIFKNEK